MFISSVAPALSSLPIYNLTEILRSSGMSQVYATLDKKVRAYDVYVG